MRRKRYVLCSRKSAAFGAANDPLDAVDCTFAYSAESPPHALFASAGTISHSSSEALGIPMSMRFFIDEFVPFGITAAAVSAVRRMR